MKTQDLAAGLRPLFTLLAIAAAALLAQGVSAAIVAVGNGGTILGSVDGADWDSRSGPTSSNLYDVAHADGRFVAVGASGTVLTSLDGHSWTQQCPTGAGSGCVSADLRSVAYAAGEWIAVGNGSTILASADGANWSPHTMGGVTGNLHAVAYGAGEWVATGATPHPCFPVCSTDQLILLSRTTGTSWTVLPDNGKSHWFNGAAQAGNSWIMAGSTGPNNWRCSYTSPITGQTNSNCGGSSTNNPCRDVHANTTHYLIACQGRVFVGLISAGLPNTNYASPTGYAVTHDGTRWVMVGAGGSSARSVSGTAWTTNSTGSGSNLYGLAVAPNLAPTNRINGATFPGGVSGSASQGMVQDTTRLFNAANANRLTIWDPDGLDSALYRVSITATEGTLTLGGTAGLSFTCASDAPVAGLPACGGSGTGEASMTFDGTMSSINAALDGLVFTPPIGLCTPDAPTITLTVHDQGNHGPGGNLWDSDTVQVNVACVPVSCSTTPTVLRIGQTTTATSSSGSRDHSWTATGPATWSGQPAAYPGLSFEASWSSGGTYTITVSDLGRPGESASCTVTVLPDLACSASPAAIVSGSPSTLTAAGPPGPYAWSGTGGTPDSGSGTSLVVTYTVPGEWNATVETSSPAQTAKCSVKVVPALTCAAAPATVMAGFPVQATAAGGTGHYSWALGDAEETSIANGTASMVFQTGGTRTLTVFDAGPPTQMVSCTVLVHAPPTCANTAGIENRPVTIQSQGGNGTLAWTTPFGIPAMGSGTAFMTLFRDPGNYTVQVSSGGRNSSCIVSVAALPPAAKVLPAQAPNQRGVPGAPFSVPLATRGPCGDFNVTLNGFPSWDADGLVTLWQWETAEGIISTEPWLEHEFPGPGGYWGALTVWDDDGLSSTSYFGVILWDCVPLRLFMPPAQARVGSPLKACALALGGLGTIRYSAEGLPPGASFDESGCLAWTPAEGQTDVPCIRVNATDGQDSVEGCLEVKVSAAALVSQVRKDPVPPVAEDQSNPSPIEPETRDRDPPVALVEDSASRFPWVPVSLVALALVAFLGGILVMAALRRRPPEGQGGPSSAPSI